MLTGEVFSDVIATRGISDERAGAHHTYSRIVFDSARWNGLMLRAGDVIVCTPLNCGTTSTQKLCALLVHQSATLPHSLTRLSRWLAPLAQPNVSLTRCRDIPT